MPVVEEVVGALLGPFIRHVTGLGAPYSHEYGGTTDRNVFSLGISIYNLTSLMG